MFTLERQRSSLPKRLQNADDMAKMERILQFIGGKKKTGVYVLARRTELLCDV